jgi:CRISPR-associated protein Cas1
MLKWVDNVRSGDAENMEARAAAYYWTNLFMNFKRDREGKPPNNLLNYGYAILRAVVARGLVSSGLLPTLGIHHHNRYNAYCLADDIMEPYRPYVDRLVVEMFDSGVVELDKDAKTKLLSIPVLDVILSLAIYYKYILSLFQKNTYLCGKNFAYVTIEFYGRRH